MSGGEDMNPPLDTERTRIRVNLSTAVLLTLLGGAISAAGVTGVYKNRLENVEDQAKANASSNSAQDGQLGELRTQMAVVNSKLDEMLRRQERIENKLESRQ